MAVTVAPGITEPLESVTRPEILPVTSAHARPTLKHKMQKIGRTTFRRTGIFPSPQTELFVRCPVHWSLPRITDTDACGKVNSVSLEALTVERAAGPSGFADPPSTLGCHWYCWLPKVMTSTCPVKCASECFARSRKSIRTRCAFS